MANIGQGKSVVRPEGHLQIVFLGAGRVAQHLAPALASAGHSILHIWSRSIASAEALATIVAGASASTDLSTLPSAALYILAVPDTAVPTVLAEARFAPGALVIHTAGALPLAIFNSRPDIVGGVLYPLQTFSVGRTIVWRNVPICLEAADAGILTLLQRLAMSLSQDVRLVNSDQRLQLHVAAVWACNFTNHLLGVGHALLLEAQLPWELLRPLIQETVDKALAQPPFTAQTGPAIRHDAGTLYRHEAALAAHPQWQELYRALTVSIQQADADNQPNN